MNLLRILCVRVGMNMGDFRTLVVFIVAFGWGGAISVLFDWARGIQSEGRPLVVAAAFLGFAGAYAVRRSEESE
jgi:hypothetical protein